MHLVEGRVEAVASAVLIDGYKDGSKLVFSGLFTLRNG